MINNKVKDMNLDQMEQTTAANTTKAKNTAMVHSTGQTALNIKDNSISTHFKAREYIIGRTVDLTPVIETTTKCRAKVNTFGLIREHMLEAI